MTTSAQALEEIEAMEREAAAAHDPAHMGFSGMISTVVLDRALQIASEALEEVERLTAEVKSADANAITQRLACVQAMGANERLKGILRLYFEFVDILQDGPDESDEAMALGKLREAQSLARAVLGDQT